MRTLLVLRHAKAAPEPANRDHDRELTKRGRRAAERIGQVLLDEKLIPECVLSSTAVRARETVERVTQACGYTGKVALLEELYLAEPEAYLDALKRLAGDAERALVVGHNPGLEDLVARLTGEREALPTAGLAELALPIATFRSLGIETQGKLRKVWRPKLLED
jgi:phosphohistidine phosphatase